MRPRLLVKGDRSTAGVDIVQERRRAREQAKAVEAKVVLPPRTRFAVSRFSTHIGLAMDT